MEETGRNLRPVPAAYPKENNHAGYVGSIIRRNPRRLHLRPHRSPRHGLVPRRRARCGDFREAGEGGGVHAGRGAGEGGSERHVLGRGDVRAVFSAGESPRRGAAPDVARRGADGRHLRDDARRARGLAELLRQAGLGHDPGHLQGRAGVPRQGESLRALSHRAESRFLEPRPGAAQADAEPAVPGRGLRQFRQAKRAALDDDRRRDHPRLYRARRQGVPVRDSVSLAGRAVRLQGGAGAARQGESARRGRARGGRRREAGGGAEGHPGARRLRRQHSARLALAADQEERRRFRRRDLESGRQGRDPRSAERRHARQLAYADDGQEQPAGRRPHPAVAREAGAGPLGRLRTTIHPFQREAITMRHSILLALIAAAVALVVPAALAQKQTVKIVYIGPLTGGVSANGIGGRNSADLAVRLRNENPKAKYRFELVSLDDECKPDTAVRAATKAACDNSIIAGVTHYWSVTAIATV